MPHDVSSLYRQQAITFQRRRLAGEVRLLPAPRTAAATAVLVSLIVAFAWLGWYWSVPVVRAVPCAFDGTTVSVDATTVPAGGRMIRATIDSGPGASVRTENPVAVKNLRADGACVADVELATYPMRHAMSRVFHR